MTGQAFFQSPRYTATNRIIAVVVIDDAAAAAPLAQCLAGAGIRCIELTLRTPAALAAITAMRKAVPDLIVGAGTVIFPEQVRQVIDAGAEYAVAPGTNVRAIETALRLGLPFAPGIATPSDIEVALSFDLRVMKLFPAEPLGGIDYLKAIAAPYQPLGIGFIPLGGVGAGNVQAYLREPLVIGVGGSWIAKSDAIARGDWDGIGRLAREAAALAGSPRVA